LQSAGIPGNYERCHLRRFDSAAKRLAAELHDFARVRGAFNEAMAGTLYRLLPKTRNAVNVTSDAVVNETSPQASGIWRCNRISISATHLQQFENCLGNDNHDSD
jgi:hypothetical protein